MDRIGFAAVKADAINNAEVGRIAQQQYAYGVTILLFAQKFGVRFLFVVGHLGIEVIIVKQFMQNPTTARIGIELQIISTIHHLRAGGSRTPV